MSTPAETATTCVDLVRRHGPRLMREQLGTQASREEMRAAILASSGPKAVRSWLISDDEKREFRRLFNCGKTVGDIATITGRRYDYVREYLKYKTT